MKHLMDKGLLCAGCLLVALTASEVSGRGFGGGGRSFARSESYGSVRQSTDQFNANNGQSDWNRSATGLNGNTFNNSGTANFDNGQANWNQELNGPNDNSINASGDANFDDGQLNVNRDASGPEGGIAESSGSAQWNDGQVNAARATTINTPNGGSYSAVRVGSRVTTLPVNYRRVYYRGNTYYYYGGYCYQPYYGDADCTYTVIQPPVGVVIYDLPDGTTTVEIGGVKYYLCNGVYYRQIFSNGQVGYQVVSDPS
jgi:hypothetical protein